MEQNGAEKMKSKKSSASLRISRQDMLYAGQIIFIMLITFLYYFYRISVHWQSSCNAADFQLYMHLGRDIFKGNILLKDWIASTNTYYSLSLFYGFAGLIFGYNTNLMAIVTSLIYSIFWGVITRGVQKAAGYSDNTVALIISTALLIVFSIVNGYNNGEIMYAGSHQDVTIIALLFFFFCDNYLKSGNTRLYNILGAVFIVILGIEVFSDTLIIPYCLAPIALISFINVINDNNKKQHIMLLGITVLSFAFGIIVKIIFNALNGVQLQKDNPILLSTPQQCIDNIGLYIQELLFCFNGDIFGRQVSTEDIMLYAAAAFTAAMIAALIILVANKRKFGSLELIILCQQAIILLMDIVIYYSLNFGSPQYSIRIHGPMLAGFTILFINGFLQLGEQKQYRIIQLGIGSIASILLILQVRNVITSTQINWYKADAEIYGIIAEELQERDLTHGYSTYYESFPITAASDWKSEVRAVYGPQLSRFVALNKKSNDWDYANFIVLNSNEYMNWGLTEEAVINSIGTPAEIVKFDGYDTYTLYIWDKNIMDYIYGIKDAVQ